MGLHHSFERLSTVVEQLESRTGGVRDLEVTADDGAGAVDATLTVPVSLCMVSDGASGGSLASSVTPRAASLTDDSDLAVTFSTSGLLSDLSAATTDRDGSEIAVRVADRDVRVVDEEIVATIELHIGPVDADEQRDTAALGERDAPTEPAAGARRSEHPEAGRDGSEDTLADRLAAARTEDVPPFDDTEYLRTLYESCDTFTEMSEYIPMDVSAETVRRYMIEAGVHQPNSYDTADPGGDDGTGKSDEAASEPDSSTTAERDAASEDDEDATSAAEQNAESDQQDATATPAPDLPSDEQLVTDGSGLAAELTVDDVVDTIVDATSVCEVGRSLELDHDRTRELLDQLGVLEFVVHRINGPPQNISRDDVVRRIRRRAQE